MATTKYSHAFLVGSFNGEMRPEQLMSNNQWKKVSEAEEYPWLCTMYYKGHLDAMLDVNDERPLKDISHYKFNYCEKDSEGNDLYGRKVVKKMTKNMGKDSFFYQFRVLSLHLYFFPFNTVLMAIELEDSGTELNELTAAHSKLVDFSTYDCE